MLGGVKITETTRKHAAEMLGVKLETRDPMTQRREDARRQAKEGNDAGLRSDG